MPPPAFRRVAEAPLAVALGQLEVCLAGVAAESSAPPAKRALALGAVEKDLLLVLAEHERDPSLRARLGHPTLTAVEAWRDEALALGEADEAAAAESFVEKLVVDEAARWRAERDAILARPREAAWPAEAFAHLMAATALEREALLRDRDENDRPPLDGDRDVLRAAFGEAIALREPADPAVAAECDALVDAADEVLTSVDGMLPERAGEHLTLVAGDLAWHQARVDKATQRSAHGRRLRRRLRRLRVEVQERNLQSRLERRFGSGHAARFERLVLWMILLVVGILTIETIFDLPRSVRLVFIALDTLACGVFLLDFFVRWSMVEGRASWFRRHFLIDLVPSLPVGLLAIHEVLSPSDQVRWGRLFRLIRITRVARYVRVLMPLIRLVRAFGFLSRGIDRLVRRHGDLLNRNVILFPTREERQACREQVFGQGRRAWRLHAGVSRAFHELLRTAQPEERRAVLAARRRTWAEARDAGWTRRPPALPTARARAAVDVPAEVFLDRLEGVTAEEVEAEWGHDFVARCARAARVFARPPLRWLPLIRACSPRIAPRMSDAQLTAATAQRMGAAFRKHYNRVTALADLHGTVTPAEAVDRVGTLLFRASLRPARRLLLLGGAFLLLTGIAGLFAHEAAGWAAAIERLVGDTLLVLGSVCMIALGIGWWLRSLAGQATAFYEQIAEAQYLALTESIKGCHLERDASFFDARVLGPEAAVCGVSPGGDPSAQPALRRAAFLAAIRAWLVQAPSPRATRAGDALDRVVMLYRDSLDGALFCESDVRTTAQLLGAPALQGLLRASRGLSRRDRKSLARLDLTRRMSLLGGPWLWHGFVSKAVVQLVARLLVDFNRYAIPQGELARSTPEELAAYEHWLGDASRPRARETKASAAEAAYLTTSFTALHLLDDNAHRDEEVETRFGARVRARLEDERKALIRGLFGTMPRHLLPKDDRVANLYRLYESWLQGGRALLLPFRVAWAGCRGLWAALRWLCGAVLEVRRPRRRIDPRTIEAGDFTTALRKIDRMRGPVVWACIELRARFDPEYVGVRLPGLSRAATCIGAAEADVKFAGGGPARSRFVAEAHRSAHADMERLAKLCESGLLDRLADRLGAPGDKWSNESLRTLAVAYRANLHGVRTRLSADDLLEEALAIAPTTPLPPRPFWPKPGLWRAHRAWCRRRSAPPTSEARRVMWRMIRADDRALEPAMVVAARPVVAARARVEGEAIFADLLRHPRRISEALVTLRAVQTLSLIDLLNYREQVYRLGRYADSGDEPAGALPLAGADMPTVG